ncbi:MAG: ATP-binding protein, partial [Deltaproteobacteria bacterium]|nr:ATP-binding protein [Deltaproteobacteria bacterium]
MIPATFSLKTMPFQKNVPEEAIFYNKRYREMKSRLLHLFDNMGIGLFTGEVGSGKSTMLRITAQALNAQLYRVVYLYRGMEKLGPFYLQLAQKLGIQPKYRQAEIASQVTAALAELYTERKIKTVLILDEAHLLKPEILDEIRLLHNAEMDSQDYLATAIAGQPPIRKMMGYLK